MTQVGLRQLKNELAAYVRRVRAGEVVVITDRGQVVAELGPPRPAERPDLPPGWLEMARQGELKLGERRRPGHRLPVMPRLLRGISAQELLDQDRDER